jgi:hypothetical protein
VPSCQVPSHLNERDGFRIAAAWRTPQFWSIWGNLGAPREAGPALIAQLRETQLSQGIPKSLVYDRTLYIMAAAALF